MAEGGPRQAEAGHTLLYPAATCRHPTDGADVGRPPDVPRPGSLEAWEQLEKLPLRGDLVCINKTLIMDTLFVVVVVVVGGKKEKIIFPPTFAGSRKQMCSVELIHVHFLS